MFRFTIRDVLWLTVVSAFAVSWWIEYRYRGRENTTLRRENAELNWKLGSLIFAFETDHTIEFEDSPRMLRVKRKEANGRESDRLARAGGLESGHGAEPE
jgi:hypothetical protein